MNEVNSVRERGDLTRFLAEVFIQPKPVVNDPQGLAIRDGLHTLGYNEVDGVRAGKYLRLSLEAAGEDEARRRVEEMCDRLLSNPVIEQYAVTLQIEGE